MKFAVIKCYHDIRVHIALLSVDKLVYIVEYLYRIFKQFVVNT